MDLESLFWVSLSENWKFSLYVKIMSSKLRFCFTFRLVYFGLEEIKDIKLKSFIFLFDYVYFIYKFKICFSKVLSLHSIFLSKFPVPSFIFRIYPKKKKKYICSQHRYHFTEVNIFHISVEYIDYWVNIFKGLED